MILTLLCLTCLLGFVGFAADVGTLFYAKRNLQIAADAAAIAGAAEMNYSDMTSAADAAAAQNGVIIGTNGGGVAVNDPPTEGAYHGQTGYVEAVVWQTEPTFFMKMFHITSQRVAARAVATLGSSGGCIYTMDATGADISITGNASMSLPNCGVVDDSSSSNALSLTGNATLTAQSIGVVGGTSETGNIHVSPTPITGIAPAGNPLASLPNPTVPSSCPNSVNLTGNVTQTISPGCYSGISATGNISLTLNPGLYIVDGAFGGFTGNVTLTGTGVTLYLLGSTNLIGNVSLDLTAPTSGTYNGILMDQPSSNTQSLSLVGNSGSTLEGIIYAPGANVSFTGNSSSNVYTDFVVGSLTLLGNAGFNDYAAIAGNNTPLTAVKLVE
jgi:hypothetical protein